ncbi:cell division protein FtsI, partial [Enterococcus sp. S181_ASV_20]|nr:cell division protein FtsI [Enterococcus sp. S181_ASV_20]
VNGNEKLYAQEKNFDDLASILNKYLGIKEKSALKTLKSGLNSDGTSKYYQVEFGNKGKNISEETKQNIEDAMKKDKVKGLYFTEHT